MKNKDIDFFQTTPGDLATAKDFARGLVGDAAGPDEGACGYRIPHLSPPPSEAFGCFTAAEFSRIQARAAQLPARPLYSCLLTLALAVGTTVGLAQTRPSAISQDGQSQTSAAATENVDADSAQKLPPNELNSLVAPIALYPDPLLIQVLAASTYPLEVVQLKQWLDENKKLKGNALADAVAQQSWDPSVQALAAFPAIVNRLANKIQWTTDLGNAFLAQESDVMEAVQTLRIRAQKNGALKSNDKQTVETENAGDGKQAITIEPAQRDVVYVPSYNTQVVYRDSNSSGYSDYSGYSDSSGYSSSDFGYDYSYVGYALAAAYGSYWGCYNWRDRYAEVNYNNRYNWNSNNKDNNWNNKINNWDNKNNYNAGNKPSQVANQSMGKWQHDPTHRGSAPYANRNLASRFGQGSNRFGQGSVNRAFEGHGANAANQFARGSQPSQFSRTSAANQLGRSNLNPDRLGAHLGGRSPYAGAVNHIGNRMPSDWAGAGRGGAFGPADGYAARAFSARGAESMRPPAGFREGPPDGFRGGPPGGMRGGPPVGGFRGGPPIGGGGPPMGGAPPPPPPHP